MKYIEIPDDQPDGAWVEDQRQVMRKSDTKQVLEPPTWGFSEDRAPEQPRRGNGVPSPTVRLKLEPLAGAVFELDGTGLSDSPPSHAHSQLPITNDWAFNDTGASIPTSATKRASHARRPLLLMLMAVMLASIAIWTPSELQAKAATVLELLFSTEAPVVRTAAGPGPLVGQLDVTSTPSGIELIVDDERRGITPLQVVLTAGQHELLFVSPRGNVRRTVRVSPGHITLYSEAIFSGSLVVISEQEVEVRLGSRSLGRSSDGELILPPGTHLVSLVNSAEEVDAHRVEILPGQVVRLDADATLGN